MSSLRYGAGQLVLGYSKAEDILSFILVCKKYLGFCDEIFISAVLVSRFKETQLDSDFDAERRTACDIQSDFHWLWMLEQNLGLIVKHRQSFHIPDVNYRPAIVPKQLHFNIPDSYKVVDLVLPPYILVSDRIACAVLVQPSAHSDTELWTYYIVDGEIKKCCDTLPLDGKCIQQITLGFKHWYLLSHAGVVWVWDPSGDEAIEK
eukprot:Platyproteum_vivax@DN7435_c5_g9_i1.p1